MTDSTETVLEPIDKPIDKPAAIGSALSNAREEQKLTVDDVCTRLRISPRQVRALENDDFAALPEAMITRGFIRNYARLLGIDAEPLLQAYRAYAPSEAPRALTIQSENILISGKDKRPWFKYILASLLIALLVGAWQFYMDYVPKPDKQVDASAEMSAAEDGEAAQAPEGDVTMETLPVPALPAAERAPEESALESAEPVNPAPVAPSAAVQPQAVPAPVITPDPLPSTQPQAAVKSLARLKLSVSEKSWINVTDKDKKIIFDRILPAGSEQVVEGQPPLAVVIGNAPASTLVYNDKPVDLAPYTQLNVARITLE